MPLKDIPAMITYSGYEPDQNKWEGWGESLVDCLYPEADPQGETRSRRLTGPEYQSLSCQEYTGPLLIDYLDRHYRHRLMGLSCPGSI
jgi:hypothetical protein